MRIAILGCSDGKFVLPAARRGHRVLAVDVDEVALFGGDKVGPKGLTHMAGLAARLTAEGLESTVRVVHDDLVQYRPPWRSHGVLTSGAVQYSRNLQYSVDQIVGAVQRHVACTGFLYVDYMLPLERKHFGRTNFPTREHWAAFFPESEWHIVYNRVLPPVFERAHVDYAVDHYHHWGHLLVRRLR